MTIDLASDSGIDCKNVEDEEEDNVDLENEERKKKDCESLGRLEAVVRSIGYGNMEIDREGSDLQNKKTWENGRIIQKF